MFTPIWYLMDVLYRCPGTRSPVDGLTLNIMYQLDLCTKVPFGEIWQRGDPALI